MPPITKDSDTLTATRETAARSGPAQVSSGDSAVKQQPVSLEVPVSVNGARTIEGSDKREPFSETTKTVLVHGAGAVIRLTSAVTPGQLLFLTNERTKKEVVCQVVKSKNYRNTSGYVELEFTEAAVGFWGMRFPGDHLSPASQAAPAAVRPVSSGSPALPRPSAPKVEKTAPAALGRGFESKPAETKSIAPQTPSYAKPAAPTAPASSIVPPPIDSGSLLGATKQKPSDFRAPTAPVVAKPAAETPLVEPWLKKTTPRSNAPAAPQKATSPELASNSKAPAPVLPTEPSFELSRPADQAASIFAPSEPPSSLLTVDLSTLAPFFETKPAVSEEEELSTLPPAPTASDTETKELKQHTARLQEQLSNMNFTDPQVPAVEPLKAAAEPPSVPAVEQLVPFAETNEVHEKSAQILENSNASSSSALLPEPLDSSKDASPSAYSALERLEQEELKIPAWLEPLARNASAPSSTQELVLREKTKRKSEQPKPEDATTELAIPKASERATESRVPDFGSALAIDAAQSGAESPARKSGKGMVFVGVAAGIVLAAAAGWWYVNQSRSNVPNAEPAAVTTSSENSQTSAPKETATEPDVPSHGAGSASQGLPPKSNASSQLSSANRTANPESAGSSIATARSQPPSSNSRNNGSVVTASASTLVPREPEPVQAKKPSLGEVHLAAPKISHNRKVQGGTEADAGAAFSNEQPEASTNGLGAGLGMTNNQPVAPAAQVEVGGDVKQARLVSSVAPVYPTLAKQQHVSGNVTVDALIDANGRVTSTKVISGPALLHQAAIDALKQWKYQPATLDGKPVAMHLSVTVQFRLQQ